MVAEAREEVTEVHKERTGRDLKDSTGLTVLHKAPIPSRGLDQEN